ncbi:hypothetical protein Acr_12g0001310 [Actinidia rufa]|uniref:Uncharacterized protein n=1 Tax=Actinidia rufa TaxID=165716 RepID=A0A7J0FFW5_9ERIC|nr:hypothetical protein Acr_12g0001310 [Actinidia rufa]
MKNQEIEGKVGYAIWKHIRARAYSGCTESGRPAGGPARLTTLVLDLWFRVSTLKISPLFRTTRDPLQEYPTVGSTSSSTTKVTSPSSFKRGSRPKRSTRRLGPCPTRRPLAAAVNLSLVAANTGDVEGEEEAFGLLLQDTSNICWERISDEIGARFRCASEEEAPIGDSWGDLPPLCAILTTKAYGIAH